jgi:hypothetical protein
VLLVLLDKDTLAVAADLLGIEGLAAVALVALV